MLQKEAPSHVSAALYNARLVRKMLRRSGETVIQKLVRNSTTVVRKARQRRSTSSSFKQHLSSVVENTNSDEVPKSPNQDPGAASANKPPSFRSKVSNLMEFRSNDQNDSTYRASDLHRCHDSKGFGSNQIITFSL
jgi:hypothetical protein